MGGILLPLGSVCPDWGWGVAGGLHAPPPMASKPLTWLPDVVAPMPPEPGGRQTWGVIPSCKV